MHPFVRVFDAVDLLEKPGQRLPINIVPRDEILKSVQSDKLTIAVKNGSGDDPAEILMYGEIGIPPEYGGIQAIDVGRFLNENKRRAVHVRINSPGGLAYDGVTMHNALIAHDGPVTTTVEGIAASAASIVAVAGMPARMYENASLFIHRALALVIGNTDVMRDTAEFLDKVDDGISRTYGAKAGKPRSQFLTLMRGKVDGTTLTADEAKKLGLIDQVLSIGGRTASAEDAVTLQPAGGAPVDPATALQAEAQTRLQNVEAARARRMRERGYGR